MSNVKYAWCSECQHISIAKDRCVEFDHQYNNDQTSSAIAVAHNHNVATEIENILPNRRAKVTEVGCGRGELIGLLKQRGYLNVQGYDPAAPNNFDQHVRNEYWVAPEKSEIDLLILRHTLEEIDGLNEFLRSVEASLTESGFIYCEITNAARLMRNQDIFSLYPECSNLFTASSLSRLLGRYGITIERIIGYHDDEWLGVWGRKLSNSLGKFDGKALVEKFIHKINELPSPVVLWGGAGRGGNILSFCETNLSVIPFVVDMNKAKQGLFIPPFGQEVVAPDYLLKISPKTILISNRKYKEEIVAVAPPNCIVLTIDELIPQCTYLRRE